MASVLVLGALTGSAFADDYHGAVRFEAHADMGGYASFGLGARLDLPIGRVLGGARDELDLSPGVDAYFADLYGPYYDGGPYLLPSAALQWNFFLAERWTVFPEAGLAFYIGDPNQLPTGRSVAARVDLGFGARYRFDGRNALVARLSSPAGLQVGVTF